MKTSKNIIKTLSVMHIFLWVTALVLVIVEGASYDGTGEEPLGYVLSIGIYLIGFVFASLGILSSSMLSLSLFQFLKVSKGSRQLLHIGTLIACIADNLLLYLSFYLLFFVNRDWIWPFLLCWVVLTFVCVILSYTLLFCNDEQKMDIAECGGSDNG